MFEMSFQTEREMLFLERNRYIQVCRENEYAVLYILSDELLQKGQKDLKTQKMIIYLWTLISMVILWIFYLTNFVMVLVLFLVSMIALSAMAAATRPVLRAKIYQAYTRKKGD